jgi:8-oxo-dGTP pyrophosphatase MutT (NUDIX family)
VDQIVELLKQKLSQDQDCAPDPLADASAAAVLILLVKLADNWNIVYTRRANGVRTHQGEVSFPGGAWEPGDGILAQTALRETMEEIGITPDCVTILGAMSTYRTITNYLVHPIVGILNCPMEFHLNLEEVERAFLIPIDWLAMSENYFEQDHTLNNNLVRRVVHYKEFDGEHLWGFTARVTQDILALIRS